MLIQPFPTTFMGSGSSYHASAVHFDGSTQLNLIGSLTGVSNSPYGLLTFWFNGTDLFNNFNGALLTAGHFIFEFDGAGVNLPFVSVSDPTHILQGAAASALPTDVWTIVMCSWDTNHPAGQKIFQVYYGDTDQSPPSLTDPQSAFSVDATVANWGVLSTDNLSGSLPGDGNGPTGDFADLQLFILGSFLDLSIVNNRRLFIGNDSKPVNPSVAAASLGTPDILFSGSASGFPTNQGTGGPFTLTGTLTNASTSPSD